MNKVCTLDGEHDDAAEDGGFVNVREHIDIADPTAVDFREDLHHDERIEDETIQFKRLMVAVVVRRRRCPFADVTGT